MTVVGHHKFAIASNVRIYSVNGFRRVGGGGGGGGGGGFKGFGRTPENPKKIQKTANFITVVA